MKRKPTSRLAGLALALTSVIAQISTALAQGTAITYQGRLDVTNSPATGLYDFRFSVYDSSSGGTLLVGPLLIRAVGVTNGLFTVTQDFGQGVFTGADRWLSIEVAPAGSGSYTLLSPRQKLTPTPYAITAGNLPAGASPTFTGTPSFNAPSGPPFNVLNTTKVPNLNADLLDGICDPRWLCWAAARR